MSDVVLFGWTMKQWAIVFGRYPLGDVSYAGVLSCKKTWTLNHAYQPGEISIAGVDAIENYADVSKMLESPIDWRWMTA